MIASVINAVLVAAGSAVGLLFRKHIKESVSRAVVTGLALCVLLIGLRYALKSEDLLCVILCMVAGLLLGEALRIEDRLDALGERFRAGVSKGADDDGRFTEGFMTATLLFCVGSMAVVGSMEAGIHNDYSIILAKSTIDCVTAVTLAAAMGVGVMLSALCVLVYQGLLTLLFIWVGPFLSDAVITEMSAVGGLLILGIGLNMLGVTKDRRVRVGNMLPAIFLPILYIPLAGWVAQLFA